MVAKVSYSRHLFDIRFSDNGKDVPEMEEEWRKIEYEKLRAEEEHIRRAKEAKDKILDEMKNLLGKWNELNAERRWYHRLFRIRPAAMKELQSQIDAKKSLADALSEEILSKQKACLFSASELHTKASEFLLEHKFKLGNKYEQGARIIEVWEKE